MAELIDRYNRKINYLRLSVTDRCNLKCSYCAGGQSLPMLNHDEILRYEELLRISRVALDLGVSKIRITGGEPLVRRGLVDFLRKLSSLPSRPHLPLTTNGVLLEQFAGQLYEAGVSRLNVSLDTLVPAKYAEITGRNCFDQVWRGIEASLEVGFSPVKINVVLMAGVNEDEILPFARLTLGRPVVVRFIEFMPIGANSWSRERLVPDQHLLQVLAELEPQPLDSGPLDGPARRFSLAGGQGEIGLISPLTHHFCHACNRLRLTPEGLLRTCLFGGQEIDLRGPLRAGASDHELARILIRAVAEKGEGIGSTPEPLLVRKCLRPMSNIGG